MTQSQTLQYVMSKVELEKEDSLFPNWNNDIFIRNFMRAYKYEIAQRDKIIHKLQLSLQKYKEDKAKEAKKLKQCYEIVKNAATVFYRFCDSTAPISLDIERGMYVDYLAGLPNEDPYQYPASSGASFVRLHACLIGEGNAPARFVLGIDENENRVKFRFYPSSYFVGVRPDNERFAKCSSVWYMAWRKTDEVAELIVAYPIQIRSKYRNPMDEVEIMHVHAVRLVTESMEIDNFIEKKKKY